MILSDGQCIVMVDIIQNETNMSYFAKHGYINNFKIIPG